NARVVADTVAAPLEQQMIGADGLFRIESESHDSGRYVVRLRFARDTDPEAAARLVRSRAALADPLLPEGVRRAGVSVRVGAAGGDPGRAAVALIDSGGHGPDALHRWAGAVVRRLAADGAVT